jgi:hypothetical protein
MTVVAGFGTLRGVFVRPLAVTGMRARMSRVRAFAAMVPGFCRAGGTCHGKKRDEREKYREEFQAKGRHDKNLLQPKSATTSCYNARAKAFFYAAETPRTQQCEEPVTIVSGSCCTRVRLLL